MEQINVEQFKKFFEKILQDEELEIEVCEDIRPLKDEGESSLHERGVNLSLKLKGRAQYLKKKAKASLFRIESGNFGRCIECDDEIPEKRLRARPFAIMCINCKEGEERKEQHLPYDKRSNTSGNGLKIITNLDIKNGSNHDDVNILTLEETGPAA